MEAKPICVIYINPDSLSGNKNFWETSRDYTKNLDETKPDYHWFVFPDYDAQKIEVNVFHQKDFTEVNYEELKSIINNKIQSK